MEPLKYDDIKMKFWRNGRQEGIWMVFLGNLIDSIMVNDSFQASSNHSTWKFRLQRNCKARSSLKGSPRQTKDYKFRYKPGKFQKDLFPRQIN